MQELLARSQKWPLQRITVSKLDLDLHYCVCLRRTFMRRVLVLAFTFFYILPLFSQSKRPFTFEDMMKLKRVGEPVPSPDGKWVVFSVVDVDLAANKKTPHIW